MNPSHSNNLISAASRIQLYQINDLLIDQLVIKTIRIIFLVKTKKVCNKPPFSYQFKNVAWLLVSTWKKKYLSKKNFKCSKLLFQAYFRFALLLLYAIAFHSRTKEDFIFYSTGNRMNLLITNEIIFYSHLFLEWSLYMSYLEWFALQKDSHKTKWN